MSHLPPELRTRSGNHPINRSRSGQNESEAQANVQRAGGHEQRISRLRWHAKLILRVAALLSGAAPGLASAQPVQATAAGFDAASAKDCHSDIIYLNQVFGWQVGWPREWNGLTDGNDSDVRDAIEQWKTAPAALAAARAALTHHSGTELAAPQIIVDRVLPEVDALRAQLESSAPPLPATTPKPLVDQWTRLFAEEILPEVRRFEGLLKHGYLARRDAPGLAATPLGTRCFSELALASTSMDSSPAEIERLGWSVIHDTERQIAQLNGVRVSHVPQLLEELRRPKANFTSADLVRKSEDAVERAKAALPRYFLRPLLQDLRVQAMPAALEASSPAGFYQPAPRDRPASLVLNLSRPGDRALMAEVIAFHEGLMGHHVPSGMGYPPGQFNAGFAEGWALYSEYLADEAGLYSGRLDRTGMMAKHLWAASRLVVEPGLHVHGWTRKQAVDFMRSHTALSDPEIDLEVDRYISSPGQSLSYIVGASKILAARHYAERRLGRSFDIRKFHEVVLGKGYRPLQQMYDDVVAWANSGSANGQPRQ